MTPTITKAVETILPLLKECEGFSATTYRCPANKLTIGWGRTLDVHEGDHTTPFEEEPWLIQHLEDLAVQITALHPHATVNQLAALLSFVYNIGLGAYTRSTMRRHLRDGKVFEAGNEFDKWTKAGGKVLMGLVHRRAKEKEIFTSA